MSGATVTFTSDNTSNAGVTFPRGNAVLTDASGQAAIDVRANFSIGSYTSLRPPGTATSATFSLTNTQRLTVAVPALLSGNANQLGIAWTNTLSRSMTLRATARGYDGQLIAGSGVQNPGGTHGSCGRTNRAAGDRDLRCRASQDGPAGSS